VGRTGFCVVGSRVFQEVWVSDFAWVLRGKARRESGFVGLVRKTGEPDWLTC
jgi:hypothetical protein